MSRPLRFIPPGSLVEVSSRTLHGRLLLRPSPELNEIILGILGRGQAKFEMTLHAFTFLSNHYHLLLTAKDAQQLAGFVGYLNSNLAREAGRLHKWRERLWGRRYQAIVVTAEEVAQVGRLRYVLAQGCKEGLVRRPTDWPGVHTTDALLTGQDLEGTWFDRTLEYQARRSGKTFDARDFSAREKVSLSPLPCWLDAGPEQIARQVSALLEAIEAEHAETATLQEAGADWILRQDPQRPTKAPRSGAAPWIHAATLQARRAFRQAYREFTTAFREAAERLRCGAERFGYPPGCYPRGGPWVPHPAGA